MLSTQFDVLPNAATALELPQLQNLSQERNPYWIPDFGGVRSDSGLTVNRQRALGHPPILQGVKILAGALAQMKVDLMREVRLPSGKRRIEEVREHHGAKVAKNRSINREMSSGGVMTICQFRSAMMNHAIMAGDGFAAIQRDGGGRPLQTVLLPSYPDTTVEFDTRMGMDGTRLKVHTRITGPDGAEEFWIDPIDVFQVMNLSNDGLSGYPLTELAANALGFGLAGHKYGGKSFANGVKLSGYLSDAGMPGDDTIKQNTRRFLSANAGADNANRIAYLTAGTTFTPLSMSNVDAQLVEILDADVKMQARLLNLPPFLLGMTDSSGLKMSELIAFFVQFTLGDWICNWAEQMRTKLLTEREWNRGDLFFRFDVSGFLLTNWPEFMKTITEAVGGPVLTREEGRVLIKTNPDVDDSEFLERSTGAKPTQQQGSDDDSGRMPIEDLEDIARSYLLNAARSIAHHESQKVASAVEKESDAVASLESLYALGSQFRDRLSDIFKPHIVDKYCDDRKRELVTLFNRGGRGAVEKDAANYRTRGLLLCQLQLNGKPNGG